MHLEEEVEGGDGVRRVKRLCVWRAPDVEVQVDRQERRDGEQIGDCESGEQQIGARFHMRAREHADVGSVGGHSDRRYREPHEAVRVPVARANCMKKPVHFSGTEDFSFCVGGRCRCGWVRDVHHRLSGERM